MQGDTLPTDVLVEELAHMSALDNQPAHAQEWRRHDAEKAYKGDPRNKDYYTKPNEYLAKQYTAQRLGDADGELLDSIRRAYPSFTETNPGLAPGMKTGGQIKNNMSYNFNYNTGGVVDTMPQVMGGLGTAASLLPGVGQFLGPMMSGMGALMQAAKPTQYNPYKYGFAAGGHIDPEVSYEGKIASNMMPRDGMTVANNIPDYLNMPRDAAMLGAQAVFQPSNNPYARTIWKGGDNQKSFGYEPQLSGQHLLESAHMQDMKVRHMHALKAGQAPGMDGLGQYPPSAEDIQYG